MPEKWGKIINPVHEKIDDAKKSHKTKRKPIGYWKDYNNVKKELQPIIDNEIKDEEGNLVKLAGVFPTREHLRLIGRNDLEGGIMAHHGGLETVRVKIGYELSRKSKKYWKVYNKVKKEIQPIIDMEIRDEEGNLVKLAGVFPTREHLRLIGRNDLENGISRYHGGLETVRVKMGYELDKKPTGYWKDFNNVEDEVQTIIDMEIRDEEGNLVKPVGVFPTREHLRLIGRNDLEGGIMAHHGGFDVVREKMGHAGIDMSSRGRYVYSRGVKSEKIIIGIIKNFCDEHGIPYKSGEIKVGPHHYLEFQCGKNKIIGADVSRTDTIEIVERKFKEKEYQEYVDILWIIVLSDKWDEEQYDKWNRESPDNVYVIDGRYLEEFLNSLVEGSEKFKIPQPKKDLIDALSKCTFYNKEEILKEYKEFLESKKQKNMDEFL